LNIGKPVLPSLTSLLGSEKNLYAFMLRLLKS
jgi:hypothetical protein